MLQQGGYILPQFSSGKQTYQAPNAGMQALQTMMQVDQQGQNRYMQGEQLNLQRSQNTQNIINSTIQNEMSRKTNERLQKQMELSNKKLEFDMQKSILDDMDKQRTEIQSSFLSRDRMLYEEMLKKQGLDEASMVGKMKGDQAMENWTDHRINERAFRGTFKNGYTNIQTYNQAKDFVTKGEQQLKQAQELIKNDPDLLDSGTLEKYMTALNTVVKETVDFENGTVQNLDFSKGSWPEVIGFKEFLDEKALKTRIDGEKALSAQKLQNEMIESDVLNSKLKLEQKLQPFEVFTKMADSYKKFGETSNVFSAISTHFPGVDFNNPEAFMDAYEKAPMVVQESMREALKKDVAKEDNVKTIENLLVEAVKSGDQAKIDQATKLYQMSKQTSHTVHSDVDGNPVIKEGSLNVYPTLGVKKTQSGDIAEINVVLPGINSKINVETSGKQKGKAKLNVGGKDYYSDIHTDQSGAHFLKITSVPLLKALFGRAEPWMIGFNEIKDYDDTAAGEAFVGHWGGFMSEDGQSIMIPATGYGDAQINTDTTKPAASSGTNW